MTRERERKRQKVDNGHEMSTGLEEDRLSSLPDDIIHHILSFVDTKFAVQTCVLSSRWKLVWTILPHLNLASCQFHTLPKFSKFVDRVLSCRNHSTDVSTVDLNFRGRIRRKIVEKIASYAFSHNVQGIKIKFERPMDDDQLPPCLFSSESLKHLSLIKTFPCAHSPWNFPALTTLDLKKIWLCYDNTNSLDLFSKCVNLKNLILDNWNVQGVGVMQIFCPRLLNLTLNIGGISKISLLTPNLNSFYYNGCSPLSLSTNGLHYLDTVNLEMYMSNTKSLQHRKRDAHQLISLLQELKAAKTLRVFVDVIELLSTVPDIIEHQPSPFSNLKCLTIKFYQKQQSTNSDSIDHVIKFLLNSSISGNVIMEIPEGKVAETLSSREITDPRIRKALENVTEKLAVQCQELGLPPPRWSNLVNSLFF